MVTSIVTVVLLIGLWWLQERDSGSPEPDAARDTPSSVPSSVPSSAPSSTPSSTPSAPRSSAASERPDTSGFPTVDLADLPPEAAETLDLIDAGGPFPYPGKDGSTFGNFEGRLPKQPRGYYAEYTVPTPGAETRGARRIIAGDGGELYWTADHYDSFERIRR